MGKFYKAAMLFKEKKMLLCLEQVMAVYEQSKAEGKPDNDPATREKANALLTQMQENLLKDIEVFTKRFGNNDIPAWNFEKERKLSIFAENEEIQLNPLREEYRDLYIQVKKENSYTLSAKTGEDQEKYWEEIWNDTKAKKCFAAGIITKDTNEFVGYVAVNDTKRPLWEICIELLSDKVNRGYGTKALMLFVEKIHEITGFNEYQALVEGDNIKSQRMMDHMNAELIGIVDYFFSSEEDATAFEEENLSEIDENMTALAAKLGVEPRKLISHALDYRIKF